MSVVNPGRLFAPTGCLIEARDLVLSFGETPALRGASVLLLVPELTAEENIALPLLLGGVRRAEALHEARTWFGKLGLDGTERHRSGEMSGGQAQRVALARGLMTRPRVLFADEPTGSLDSLTGEVVMELLVGAAHEQGATVVLVTHEPRIAAYAAREIVVRDGVARSLLSDDLPS